MLRKKARIGLYFTGLVFAMFFFLPNFVSAAPAINNTSGSIIDGESLSINGSGFGTNSLKIEFLGGKNGNIDSGTNGAAASKTPSISGAVWDWYPGIHIKGPVYSSARVRARSKTLLNAFTSDMWGGSYALGLPNENISDFYMTIWTYYEPGTFRGQWKQWRAEPEDWMTDCNGDTYSSFWTYSTASGNTPWNPTVVQCNGGQNPEVCFPNNDYGLGLYPPSSSNYQPNKWVRIEVHGKASSAANVKDGELQVRYYFPDSPVITLRDFSSGGLGTVTTFADSNVIGTDGKYYKSIRTCAGSDASICQPITGTDWASYWTEETNVVPTGFWNGATYHPGAGREWHWIGMENYVGNAQEGSNTSVKIYQDDLYIQIGTQARVELCDTATWVARTHCEIQPPTAWSSGSISLTLNKGSFNNGDTAYLFVVDSNGNTNANGQQVVLGSSQGADTTAPNIPTGVTVN